MDDNNQTIPVTEEKEQNVNELRQIRLDKLSILQAAGKDPFTVTTAEQTVTAEEIRKDFSGFEGKDVSLCGRIKTWRDMGKANFIDVHDRTGRMQVYVRLDDIGEDAYKEFKKWDIGDIVEVKGFVFLTKRGEISVHAKAIQLLSKSLLPLPEKYHGITNTLSLIHI